ncbi:MAG: hypothetical protein RBG13Loki_2733 [Promethearchaeota archaeon CR_4]|nr:MAG: hypothetical protein RBG13Loki_2733 [Candidatus Lokiarchaeota archaeon CR_4]
MIMGTASNPQTCDECEGTVFNLARDPFLQRQYPFVAESVLKMCASCGAKYLACKNCGALLTRLNLWVDVHSVRDTCPVCGWQNPQITKWIA